MNVRIILRSAPGASSGEWLPYAVARVSILDGDNVTASLQLFDNPGISYHDLPTALFGKLQLPDNMQVCHLLFQTAEDAASRLGKPVLLGPMNGSTWQDYRLPLQGDAPFFAGDSTIPARWATLLEQAGYAQADAYHSSVAPVMQTSAVALPADIVIRLITAESLHSDLRLLYPLCMKAFSGAAYFTFIPEDAFAEQYESARPLMRSGLSCIALHDETAVAFVLAYPDILHPADKRLVVKTVARYPGIHIPGLIDGLLNTMYRSAAAQGLTQAIHAFMHSTASSVHRSEEWGGRRLRSYALFSKILLPDA